MNWLTLLLGAVAPIVDIGAHGALPTTGAGWATLIFSAIMPMAGHLMTPPASSPVISPAVSAAVKAS